MLCRFFYCLDFYSILVKFCHLFRSSLVTSNYLKKIPKFNFFYSQVWLFTFLNFRKRFISTTQFSSHHNNWKMLGHLQYWKLANPWDVLSSPTIFDVNRKKTRRLFLLHHHPSLNVYKRIDINVKMLPRAVTQIEDLFSTFPAIFPVKKLY